MARGRYLRHVLAVIAVLLIALVATVVVFLYTADFNQYRSIIERTVANATGRQLEIKGDLVIQMTPRPQLAVADVTLANAPWGSRPHMARVGKLLVQLEVLPLLTGTLEVSQISLVETDLLLETGPAGQTNWPVRRGATSGTSVGLKHLDVKSLEIEHLALTWRDPDTGSLGNYKVDSLELTRSATADSLKVALEGSSNGEIVSLSGATGSLSVLFSGARFPVALSGDFGPAKVALNGEIGKPRKLEGIDLAVTVSGKDLGQLSAIVGEALPTTGPFEVKGRLTGSTAALAFTGARGSIDRQNAKLALTGKVDDLLALDGISLEVDGSGQSLDELADILDMPLPATDSFAITGGMTGSVKALALRNLHATATQGNSRLAVSGDVADVLLAAGLDLSVEASGTKLHELGPMFNTQIPDLGAFKVKGQLRGSRKLLELKDLSASIDQSDFAGWAKVELGTRSKVTVRLESGLIDFTRIMEIERAEAEKVHAEVADISKAGGPTARVLSDEPLPVHLLDAIDADIRFNAHNVKAREADLEFGQLSLRLVAGALRLDKLEATYKGTKVSANLNIDAGVPANLHLRILAQGFDLGRFIKETKVSTEFEGKVDLAADLTSQGDTPHRLAANLNGSIGAVIGKGLVPRILDLLAEDLSRRVVPIWGRHNKTGQLNCGLLQFAFQDGIATSEAFVFDTQVGLINGDINLKAEQLNFVLTPKPKDPSLFSLSTTASCHRQHMGPEGKTREGILGNKDCERTQHTRGGTGRTASAFHEGRRA